MANFTYYKVMNEDDDVFITTESLREAKKVAKATAIERGEWIWVINVMRDAETAVYDENGTEM